MKIMEWIKYDFMDIKSRPKQPDRYIVRRKDGKKHFERWNGSGWAYNNESITHYIILEEPKNL